MVRIHPATFLEEKMTEKTTLHPSVRAILKYFRYGHLPAHLQEVSKPFGDLAVEIASSSANPETAIALRKLLESKDAAVRAVLTHLEEVGGKDEKKMSARVVYLAAPVSGDIDANLARLEKWFRWFIDNPVYDDVSFLCPWYLYVKVLNEGKYRDRGLRDDLIMVASADQIWCVGLKDGADLTKGMRLEVDRAHKFNMAAAIFRTADGLPPGPGEAALVDYAQLKEDKE